MTDETHTPVGDELPPVREPQPDEPTPDETPPNKPTPDETPPDEAPPDETPPEQALSEKDIERRMQSLEKEGTRHANRISDIMGEDAQALVDCPLCWPFTPGFILPAYLAQNLPLVQAAVRATWGEDAEPEYLPASNARQCDQCKGLGKRLSGSLVQTNRLLLCDTCKGAGYVSVGGGQVHPDLARTNGEPVPEPEPAGEDAPKTDPWGREPGDDNYGRLPQYVGPAAVGG